MNAAKFRAQPLPMVIGLCVSRKPVVAVAAVPADLHRVPRATRLEHVLLYQETRIAWRRLVAQIRRRRQEFSLPLPTDRGKMPLLDRYQSNTPLPCSRNEPDVVDPITIRRVPYLQQRVYPPPACRCSAHTIRGAVPTSHCGFILPGSNGIAVEALFSSPRGFAESG